MGGGRDPQSWNGYAYVGNNPLGYSDPTGMWDVPLSDEAKDGVEKAKDAVGSGIDAFKSVVYSAEDKLAECWASQTCKTVLVTAGVIGCSVGTGIGAAGCSAAGMAILSAGDATDCMSGSAGGCGRVAVAVGIEIASAGAAKYGAPMLGRLGSRYAGSLLASETGALRLGARSAASGMETVANEGVYVTGTAGRQYVGQSGNIAVRLSHHVSDGRFTRAEVALAERIGVPGGRTAREVAEQLKIDDLGAVGELLNVRNPIGRRRFHLMPDGYER